MSHALARLCETTGDPLLVRAGRGLASPRALALHDVVGRLVRGGHPLCEGELTAARYAAASPVHVSRREHHKSPSTTRWPDWG